MFNAAKRPKTTKPAKAAKAAKPSPLAIAGAVATGLVMAGGIVVSEIIRSQILAPTRARTILDTTVRFTDRGTVILPGDQRSWVPEVGLRTARSFYRLDAPLGEVDLTRTQDCERPVTLLTGPQDPPGTYGARYFTYGWTHAQQAGMDEQVVVISTPLGDAPAKLWTDPTRPQQDTWVIGVHGRGAIQEELLRHAKILTEAGHPFLAITYRNDQVGGPLSDGISHMGASEWEDVDHAIAYALTQGAKQVILLGASQGGSLIGYWLTAAMQEPSSLVSEPSKVVGLILDCPLIQVYGALSAAIHESGVPKYIDMAFAMAAVAWMTIRGPRQVVLVDHLPVLTTTDLPILIFLGLKDSMVSPDAGLELAQYPHVTSLIDEMAEHVENYNEDPEMVRALINEWVANLPKPVDDQGISAVGSD